VFQKRKYRKQPTPVVGEAAWMLADLLREGVGKRDDRTVSA